MGASSFSPSPITTTPSIATAPKTKRMASTAARSAAFLSPRPAQRAAAIAAASVTRINSRAILRSGRSGGCTSTAYSASHLAQNDVFAPHFERQYLEGEFSRGEARRSPGGRGEGLRRKKRSPERDGGLPPRHRGASPRQRATHQRRLGDERAARGARMPRRSARRSRTSRRRARGEGPSPRGAVAPL